MRTCLICDDHAMMLHALSSVISMSWPDTNIIKAADFTAAWAAAESQPDLILSDLSMPGSEGVEGVARLRNIATGSPIVVITANEDDIVLLDLFNLGIAGFIPKSASVDVMDAAIKLVLAGGQYVPPRVVALAGERDRPGEVARERDIRHSIAKLSDRQLEILRLIARGAQNKEIARDLDLSPATVKAHVAAILGALDSTNRTEASFRARDLGLI